MSVELARVFYDEQSGTIKVLLSKRNTEAILSTLVKSLDLLYEDFKGRDSKGVQGKFELALDIGVASREKMPQLSPESSKEQAERRAEPDIPADTKSRTAGAMKSAVSEPRKEPIQGDIDWEKMQASASLDERPMGAGESVKQKPRIIVGGKPVVMKSKVIPAAPPPSVPTAASLGLGKQKGRPAHKRAKNKIQRLEGL